MTTAARVDLTDLDMWARGVPYSEFARLRAEEPVAWFDEASPNSGFWSVHRYADIMTASRDTATFSSSRGVSFEEPTDEDGAVFDSTGMGGGEGADLFAQAVQIVKRDRKASTSYIQRRLQIGYNRAASLMERMEQEGIVGQANHAGKREILVEEEESRF